MEDTDLLKKIMPHNLEAEQSLLGSMLLDVSAADVATELLSKEDFYSKANGLIFDAMSELHREGRPLDPVTLSDKLKEKDAPDEIQSSEYIRNILESVPTSANAKTYAQIVYEKSTLRRLIKVSEGISEECYSSKENLEDILDKSERDIFNVVQSRNTKEFEPISEIVITALKKIREAAKNKGGITGLSTGFVDLDNMTAGLQNADLVIIGGRPSMGKTAFALSIVDDVVFKKGNAAAIFSLEMAKEQLVNRFLAMEARVDATNIRTGNLSDSDWGSLIEASEKIGGSNLIIDDTSGITISELRSKCRKYKMDHDIKLVVIDYIQLMSSGKRADNRQQEISEISRSLKGIARELNVPVVALSQLSREAEKQNRPSMSNIRESGSIEQDADVIMFLYRDDYYHPDTEEKNISEVIIAKQRNGPVGTVKLAWLPQYTRFANLLKAGKDNVTAVPGGFE